MSVKLISEITQLVSSSVFFFFWKADVDYTLLFLFSILQNSESSLSSLPTTLTSQVFFTLREFFTKKTHKKRILERRRRRRSCVHMYHCGPVQRLQYLKRSLTRLQSRQDCGMKTCGSESTTDWISWLRWMNGICSFVTWFSTVTKGMGGVFLTLFWLPSPRIM